MHTKIRFLISICVLALLLSGCKFRAMTRILPDASGELRTEVGFDAQERQNLENQNPTNDFCNVSGATEGVSVTEEQRGDESWCVTVMPFDNLGELRQFYEQRQGLRVNRLEVSDGILYYDVDVDTSSESSSFSSFESITWALSLPGAPADHNAHQAEGNTLTWNLAPHTGTVNLRAQSEARDPSGALALLLGILALAGLVVVVGFALRRLVPSRRKPG